MTVSGMDMGGMDMSGMGMDSGSNGLFRPTNSYITRIFWYLIASVVGLLTLRRGFEWARTRWGLAQHKKKRGTIPSRPGHFVLQSYDTMTAICRELAHPQLWWCSGPVARHFNPPALGRCLILLTYWIFILTALWTGTLLSSSSSMYAYKWEIVGFRAAWVSVMQLPLIYCLACKVNVISLLTGISYERLNWLHRWVSRTLFLTVIVHWSFFFREWWIADFIKLEFQMMPMVKYGFGAWSVLGWMVLSSFGYFRHLSHEFFVVQHILSFSILLWLVYVHVPAYARYHVWLAVAFVVLDRVGRSVLFLVHNLHLRGRSKEWKQKYILGFSGRAVSTTDGYVILTVAHFDVAIRPGQHVFVTIPRCAMFQSHPFTITRLQGSSSTVKMVLKAHSGFTKKLLHLAQERPDRDLRVLTSYPYGSPPLAQIERSDSLILMATSTGASYIIPILQHVADGPTAIRRIRLYWIVKSPAHLDWFFADIIRAMQKLHGEGVDVYAQAYITGQDQTAAVELVSLSPASAINPHEKEDQKPPDETHSTDGALAIDESEAKSDVRTATRETRSSESTSSSSSMSESVQPTLQTAKGRPISLDNLIRPVLEQSEGETAIIACGAGAFMADVRNYVAKVSDERAVHKGTGAQGIFLFTETYGW